MIKIHVHCARVGKDDLVCFRLHLSYRGHYFFSVYASRMMVDQGRGLIVTISSMGGLRYLFNVPYGVGKAAVSSPLIKSHVIKTQISFNALPSN